MTNRLLGRLGVATLTLAVLVTLACPVSADIILNVTNTTVQAGNTGYVEVYVTGATAGDGLSTYSVGMDLLDSQGNAQNFIKFTGAELTTDHAAFYGAATLTVPGDVAAALPGTFISANNMAAAGYPVPAQNAGLMKLNFTVPAGTPAGVYQLAFRNDELYTNFTTVGDEGYYNFSAVNGTVTVTPEPSTIVLLAMGLVGMVAYARRKRS